MLVKFNAADEFVEELRKEPLAKPLVRLTYLRKANQKIFVVATAKAADGDLIKLEHYCGALWEHGPDDEKAQQHAEDVSRYIENHCQDLKLEVRAGIFEEVV